MKRIVLFLFSLVFLLPILISCSTVTVLNSSEAKEKMEKLGYTVDLQVQYGDRVKVYNIKQVTILTADKDEDFIQVYYFTNEDDTDTFYSDRTKSLSRGVEVIKKNKYSIYRGTQVAVDDFLE